MSASSGSVRLYYHPSGAALRTIRFSKYVYDLNMDTTHFVTSHQVEYIIIMLITIVDNFIQDGTLNFWSLSACLEDTM